MSLDVGVNLETAPIYLPDQPVREAARPIAVPDRGVLIVAERRAWLDVVLAVAAGVAGLGTVAMAVLAWVVLS